MTPEILDTASGAKLICLSTDQFKCELLGLTYLFPSETISNQQNAAVLSLSQHGTENYPSRQALSLRCDDLYSTLVSLRNRTFGDMQMLGITAEFLGERYVGTPGGLLPDVVSLLSEMLLSPHLENGVYPDEAVELTRRMMGDGIRSMLKNPRVAATQNCMELLCPGEGCTEDLPAALDSLRAMTAKTLAARFTAAKNEICPLFFYIGNTDGKTVANLLSAAFSFSAAPVPFSAKTATPKGHPRTAAIRMPVAQSRLVLGFRGELSLSHPLAPAALYLNEIFGGSPASKLFLRVREEKGLCYQCSSTLDIYKGLLMAGAGIAAEKRAVAEESILAQFAAICRGEIGDAEFEAARGALSFAYRQIYDSPASLADFYVKRTLSGTFCTPAEWRRRLAAVTKAEVVAAARCFTLGAVSFVEGTKPGGEEEE